MEVNAETGTAHLTQFDGDYHECNCIPDTFFVYQCFKILFPVYQVGGVWETKEGVEAGITVAVTSLRPKKWASTAYTAGLKSVAAPTMKTTVCRCVI